MVIHCIWILICLYCNNDREFSLHPNGIYITQSSHESYLNTSLTSNIVLLPVMFSHKEMIWLINLAAMDRYTISQYNILLDKYFAP